MIKKFALIILAIAVGYGSSFAQSNKEHLKGLHRATEEELKGMQLDIGPDTIVYNVEGEKIPQDNLLPLLMGGKHTLDPFLDKDGNIKLFVMRELTDEEQKKISRNSVRNNNHQGKSKMIGEAAPDFDLIDIEGNSYQLSSLKGRVVVLNFWFIKCKPCVMEIPELNELVKKYESEDVIFLALAIDNESGLEKFLKTQQFDYKIVPNSMTESAKFGVQSYPTHIVIDKEQKVTHLVSGLSPTTIPTLDKEIYKQLKKIE